MRPTITSAQTPDGLNVCGLAIGQVPGNMNGKRRFVHGPCSLSVGQSDESPFEYETASCIHLNTDPTHGASASRDVVCLGEFPPVIGSECSTRRRNRWSRHRPQRSECAGSVARRAESCDRAGTDCRLESCRTLSVPRSHARDLFGHGDWKRLSRYRSPSAGVGGKHHIAGSEFTSRSQQGPTKGHRDHAVLTACRILG